MFGQSTFGGGGSLFGASTTPAFGGSTFGAPAASTAPTSTFTFGAPTTSTSTSAVPSFGATPAFGAATSTPSLFGAPAATTTPSFGGGGSLFGAPAASTSTSSLFGAPAAQPAASTAGAFPFSFSGGAAAPAAAPATGSAFSFGGTSATPAFGAAPTSSAFGAAPAAGTSAFGGGGGGMFGGGAPAAGGVQGTTIAPYTPTTEKDTTSNTMVTIHNISAMPQYKDKSFEELRWEDYQLGRKGQGMGQAAAGGMFGSAAPAAGTGLFGAPASGSAFSTTSAPSTGSSLFGAPAASTGSLFGGGAATGSSLFGASMPATGTTSLFGAPAASAGTTSLFGATTSAPTATSSLFGGGATSAFGAPTGGAATSSLFPSFTGATAAAPASSAFSFGGATTPAAAPSTGGGLFGSTAPSTSLFGTSTSTDTSSSLFGGGTSSLFGGAGTGAATASTSLFGAPAASTGSSLFGATMPSTGGGLFGAPAASTGTSGGLFGGSSLFGGSTPSTPSATTSSSFPSLGGFGAGTTSAFGAPAASTGSSSLFGGATTGGTGGLFPGFGSTTPSSGLGGLMGGAGVPGAGTLVATIDSPRPYGSLPPLPPLTDSDAALASAAQTRAALAKPKHYKLTARSPAAGRSLGYYQNLGGGAAASKRVSFMGEIERKDLTASPLGTSASTPDAFTRRKLILETDENVAMPEISEFRVTGGTPLVDRRAMADLPPQATPYAPSAAPEQAAGVVERERVAPTIQIQPATPSSPVVGLYPTLPAREIQQSPQSQSQAQQAAGDTPLPARTLRKPVAERPIVNYDQFSRHVRDQDRKRAPVDEEVERLLPRLAAPGYWMEPGLDELRHMTKAELGRVEGLVVGREGYGQIEFLEPVDVRGVDLNQLIVIDRHLITVFPDDATKPPRGQGLNVRARLTIEEAWPEHRDAESLEEYEAFLRKRGSRRKQRFVAYDRQRGAWTFDVPGF